MKPINTVPNDEVQDPGALESMTEFKIKHAQLRNPLAQWLNETLSGQVLPRVLSIHFEPSSDPNIIEVHLEIAGSSFEKAE